MSLVDLRVRARQASRPLRTAGDGLVSLGQHVTFYVRTIASIPFALTKYRKHVLGQISEVSFGTNSLLSGGGTIGIVFAMSLAAAMMLGVETHRGLELVGMTSLSGMLSAVANTRELAPVVVAIALAAKVGTGFTAQIGAMRISDEIDALDSMAIRSIPFLAGTRVIAAMICVIPIYMIGLLASYLSTRLVVVFFNGAAEIVTELQAHSPEFVRMWELQEVAQGFDDCKTIVHPELGRIDVDGQILFTENRAQSLVVLTTRPGTDSHTKLQLLSVIQHQQFTV
ncbi:ABC transporter permease [Rhodococcus qingshengii]|uniref:ABC transporter permease n=1 Tax=Rhodococcus qingshengii TaxID=334542 RepID=UPI00145609C6|nr:ABC transporter permease [Rhodococcus qingshengii]